MLKFELHEYPMNGRKATIEKELFFFKYIGIHYARIATKVTSVVGHGD